MGLVSFPRHVLVIQADAVKPGDIQAFAATNHRWGRRGCETEEGRARYVHFKCLPFAEPKKPATTPIRYGAAPQDRTGQCFQAGIRNEIGRSLEGGGRPFRWGKIMMGETT
jgi:hypothetical protein